MRLTCRLLRVGADTIANATIRLANCSALWCIDMHNTSSASVCKGVSYLSERARYVRLCCYKRISAGHPLRQLAAWAEGQ